MSNICTYCNVDIKRTEKQTVKCVFCDGCFHYKCTELTEEQYNAINAKESIKYMCRYCEKNGFVQDIKILKNMMETCLKVIEEQSETIKRNELLLNEVLLSKSKKNSSYADIVTRRNEEILVVRPINEEQRNDVTRTDLKEKVDPSKLAAGVETIKNTKKGAIILKCSDSESKEKIKNKVEETLSEKYTVEEVAVTNRKLMIVGTEDKMIKRKNEDILETILEQNEIEELRNKVKIIKKWSKKKTREIIAILYLKRT